MKKKILGVIPARGGSKGVPGKNIKPLCGKPLIAYTIEAAIESRLLTDFIVSTEDAKIKTVAEQYGASVPFLRPKTLATDQALAVPTIQHAVEEMEKRNAFFYDIIVMLQPTAPLRLASDIDNALQLLMDSEADSVISVVEVDNGHPMKMKKIEKGYLVDYEKPPVENPPRQMLPKVYIVNGALYITRRDVLMKQNTFKGSRSLSYIMPADRSVNIDRDVDFIVGEYQLFKNQTAKA